MLERFLSYRPLTKEAFWEIAGRFDPVLFAKLSQKPRILGTHAGTGELSGNSKPKDEVLIDWRQKGEQRKITLVHESVHVYWEEGVLHDTLRALNYDDLIDAIAELHVRHESRVEAEARRFFAQEKTVVNAVYGRLGLNRRNRFNSLQ